MPFSRRTRKVLIYIACFVAVVMVAASAFTVINVRRSFPDTAGTVQLSGMSSDVEVVRDSHGIPQLYADDPGDLFMAQGYVQAQDRFFEMDFRRHVTSGRLAELFGSSALETDKVVRTMGWRRVAEREIALLDPATRRYLKAYAAGVNAYIEGKSSGELSLEYTVLGLTGPEYVPEPWTSADSVAWLKAMAWDLRSNMGDEIDRTLLTKTLSREQVDELYPQFPYEINDPIVAEGTVPDGVFDAGSGGDTSAPAVSAGARSALASVEDFASAADALPTLLGTGDGIGSNSWALSGDRTTTGEPILANDPHLAPSMPGIWYQMGLHCRTVSAACPFDVAGFTFSGMPGVVIGHNDTMALGLTTMYADVTDLYLEKVEGDRYEYDGVMRPLRTRVETFEVAGQDEPVQMTVRSTLHGPILSDVDDETARVGVDARPAMSYAVSLQWTALQPGRTMDAVFALNLARDFAELRSAARLFEVPSQNIVYADNAGHIGYQSPGKIPIRRKGDGRWPVPGWTSDYGWERYVPFDELPSVLDPEEGYVVTANQQVIGEQYPYLIGTGQAEGYRSQRIIDEIEAGGRLSVADSAAMQRDTYNVNAAELVPYLLRVELGTRYYRDGQQLLRSWDLHQDADSAAAAYFSAVWRNLLALTFDDQLPEEARPEGGERWFEVVRQIVDDPASTWWDDTGTEGVVEQRDDILTRAMRAARDELTRLEGPVADNWTWGQLHTLTLTNQSLGRSGVYLVEAIFNRGPYELGGGGGLVDATSWDATEGYEVTAMPSMRMVVDVGDFDASRWIELGGQSGHAYADNYVDQAEIFLDGETLPWAWSPEAVTELGEDVLRLEGDGSAD